MKQKLFAMDIRRRVLLVVLSGSLLTLLAMSLLSFAGMSVTEDKVIESGQAMGENAARFTEEFAEKQATKRISAIAQARAERIEHELKVTADDVRLLADVMTELLRSPEDYPQLVLPAPRRDTIASGESYLHLSAALDGSENDDAQREMGRATHLAGPLHAFSRTYSAAFAGSRHGYLVAMDVTADGGPKQFSQQFLENYDPREMGWYKLGARSRQPDFTDVYRDSNGQICITCVAPFHDDSGFAGVVGIDVNPEEIYREAVSIASEEGPGASFVLGPTGRVLFSTRTAGVLAVSSESQDLRLCEEKSLAFEAASMLAGKSDVQPVTVDGEEYYLAYAPIGSLGWSFGMLTGKDAVIYPGVQARDNVLSQMNTFTGQLRTLFRQMIPWAAGTLLLLVAILSALGVQVSGHFARPILALTEGVKEIAHGNLDRKLDLRTGDEIEHLAGCVNDMTDALKESMESLSRVTAEKERIATELSIARNIQTSMLPSVAPRFSQSRAYKLGAAMTPAKEVGGDFYDFYMLDDRHLAVTIADVSGKGVPAALFMVVAKTVLKNAAQAATAQGKPDFAAVIGQANRQLCENNDEMMFVTVFFGVLDIGTGDFTYVNAGHNPPLLYRATAGRFDYLPMAAKTSALGIKERAVFTEDHLALAPGDTLLLYTDGVTEALNEAGELYAEARLEATLNRQGGGVPVDSLLAAVRDDLRAFAGAAEQSDDITVLALRYQGQG